MLKKFQGLYSTLVKYDPIFTRHEIKEAAVVEYNLQFSYIRLVRFNLAFAQFEIYSYFTMYKPLTISCRKLLFQVATCCFLPFSLDISIKTQVSIRLKNVTAFVIMTRSQMTVQVSKRLKTHFIR